MDTKTGQAISTTGAPPSTLLTRWSPWLRLDEAEWQVEVVPPSRLPELDLMAADTRAAWEARALPAEIGEIYKRLSIACVGKPGDDATRKAAVALFLRYLAGYPAAVLVHAGDAWITTHAHMPAIAEFRALCDAEMTRLERLWRRAAALASHSRADHARRADEAARAAEIAAANARVTPERWAEIVARRDAIPTAAPVSNPRRDAFREHLAKRRAEINARIPRAGS